MTQANPLEAVQRADAPYDLTDEQAEEWWAIVNRMPADWFPRETHALLAQYCKLVTRARRLGQLLNEMEQSKDFNLREYQLTVRTEAACSKSITMLATRMRMSQQSSFDKTRKRGMQVKRPWESAV